jgi:hypothetical protein
MIFSVLALSLSTSFGYTAGLGGQVMFMTTGFFVLNGWMLVQALCCVKWVDVGTGFVLC